MLATPDLVLGGQMELPPDSHLSPDGLGRVMLEELLTIFSV